MPELKNLIKDIYAVVGSKEGWFDRAIAEGFSRELGLTLLETTKPREEVPRLRLSQMGEKCPSALWHSIHSPMDAEPFPPWALIKFTYGHILEALVIAMARAAGHEVTGEQDELILDGVKGHRDCVIDGCTVDVKSLNSRGFQTLKDGRAPEDIFLRDYLDQLDGYTVAAAADPLVRVKDRAYILAIDKTLGHLYLYEHTIRVQSIRERITKHKEIIGRHTAPTCTCGVIPEGKSGNLKLDVKSSYNNFKYCCFPHLRTFLYSEGPRYLTKVVRRPTNKNGPITEIDRLGNIVYN